MTAYSARQTDSTSAGGWLQKSNFDVSTQTAKLLISQYLARLIVASKAGLYSQWFPEDGNDVSNSMSREFNIPDTDLVSVFHHAVPQQTPQDFEIRPLPSVISSFMISLM
jgi:hypothetical protein